MKSDAVNKTAKCSGSLCNPTTNLTSYSTTCFNQWCQVLKLINHFNYIPCNTNGTKSYSVRPIPATSSFVLVRPSSPATLCILAAMTRSSLQEHTSTHTHTHTHTLRTSWSTEAKLERLHDLSQVHKETGQDVYSNNWQDHYTLSKFTHVLYNISIKWKLQKILLTF